MAQSVKQATSAPVMISLFVGSSPASGSVLTAQSLEPASDSVSPSLSAPPPLVLCLFLSLKNKSRLKRKFKKIKKWNSSTWSPAADGETQERVEGDP